MNRTKPILAVAISIAIAFFSSCSSTENDNGNGVSSSSDETLSSVSSSDGNLSSGGNSGGGNSCSGGNSSSSAGNSSGSNSSEASSSSNEETQPSVSSNDGSSSSRVSSSSSRISSSSSAAAAVSSSSATTSSSSSSSSAGTPTSASSVDSGTKFTPEMLALTPGATIAELNLAWYSGREGTKTAVRLFNASGTLVNTVTGTTGNATTGKSWHKAKLTNLTPSTQYKYSVSNDEQNWSHEYDYTTPPATGAWRFVAIADPQIAAATATSYTSWAEVAKKIKETENVTHVVCAGDQVDNMQGDEKEWEYFFAPGIFSNIPVAAIKGNHDPHWANIGKFEWHFNLPNERSASSTDYKSKYNYYYLYNNVLFVGLNTGSLFDTDQLSTYNTVVNLFKTVITEAKAAHAGKYDWLIVVH
ncbi:MAG: fibronectin type III domain-containing protein, partial [Fibromonadales bacterium]|nr:fibronectin type III domain-containing protein [Fibromonadales bacterium]